jgi:DNA-binding response OmpR family regulator
MAGLIRKRLLESLEQSQPRFLRIIAPAGYGKSTLARQYADRFQRVAVCDCLGATGGFELVKRLAYALSSTSPHADALMLEALGFGEDVSAWTAFCRKVWHTPDAPDLLLIENGEALQEDLGARSVVMELLSAPNPTHCVCVCSRTAFSLRSGRFAAPNETVSLSANDLRFDRSEIASVLDKPQDDHLAARVEALTEGWPMAVLLVCRLLEEGKLFVLDEADRVADLESLYDYLAEQILESLDSAQRELLTTLAFTPNPTLLDLQRLERRDRKKILSDLSRMAPFVALERQDQYAVHPLMRAMLRERHKDAKAVLLERVAHAAEEDGDSVRAAQLYFEAGNQHAAARVLNVGSVFLMTPPPAIAELMSALDPDVLIHYPALWNVAAVARTLLISPLQWMREGEFVWRNLTHQEPLPVRAGVMMSLANCYANDGRFADALALCDEFESKLSEEERLLGEAAVYFFRTAIRLYSGLAVDFDDVRERIAPFLENPVTKALVGYDFESRIHRLNGDRANERAALERALNTALETKLPLVISLVAMDAAFGAWLAGEDELFDRYLALLEEHSPASVINGCRIFIDAARGRLDSLSPGSEKIKSRAYAYVIAATKASEAAKARSLALHAVAAADHSAQPFAQVLARVCRGTIDTDRRSAILAEARQIAAQVSSESFRRHLDRVISGDHAQSMWSKLIGRLRKDAGSEDASRFDLHIAKCRLDDSNGRPIALTNRELELLAFLSLGKRPVSNDEIVDAIWPENPETGHSSLKVVVARIRQKTASPSIVQSTRDGYMANGVDTRDMNELSELSSTIRRGAAGANWNEGDVERLLSWLRTLRDGFPASVAKWPWFGAIDARCQRELYDAALLCARVALDAGRFDLALQVASELLNADPGDDLAREITARARASVLPIKQASSPMASGSGKHP